MRKPAPAVARLLPALGGNVEITIAGCGAITAVGENVAALHEAVRANRSGLRPCERFSGPAYQSNILGAIAGREGGDDPAFHMADRALRDARAQAAGVLDKIPPAR